jgi:excinuclease ABC subunit C
MGKIESADYRKNIRLVRDFFEGKKARVLSSLSKELKASAKKLEFERAAKVRDQIYALNHLKEMFIISRDNPTTVFSRIEGYDISNISGVYAVGSMVVFIDGISEKSEYRKFKIKWVKGANDTAMMKEILIRRFRNDWPHPDLILVDGGRGQVNAATDVLKNLKLNIPVIGLAKGPDRKKDEVITNQVLPRKDIVIFKQVRDEAHRFAKGYYEKLHRRSSLID